MSNAKLSWVGISYLSRISFIAIKKVPPMQNLQVFHVRKSVKTYLVHVEFFTLPIETKNSLKNFA